AADWMTAAWDQIGSYEVMSPANAAVEATCERWLLDLLGLPAGASAGFVTGAQGANTTCLAAARHAVLRDAGWDVEERGLAGAPIRGRPMATSGSTFPMTPASRSSRTPTCTGRRWAFLARTCRRQTSGGNRSPTSPKLRAARALSRSTLGCARSGAAAWPSWSSAAATSPGRWPKR